MADKDVTKQLCGALATKFEAFTGEANRPEEVLALWADITWTVEQGVSHQRILSTLALITAKGRAQLCAAPSPKSLEAWRTDLSATYLAGANRGHHQRACQFAKAVNRSSCGLYSACDPPSQCSGSDQRGPTETTSGRPVELRCTW